jgi:hypothetical protein
LAQRQLSTVSQMSPADRYIHELSDLSEQDQHGSRKGRGRFLIDSLRLLGFETDSLKTDTPAQVDSTTIDYCQLEVQPGDDEVCAYPPLHCLCSLPSTDYRP